MNLHNKTRRIQLEQWRRLVIGSKAILQLSWKSDLLYFLDPLGPFGALQGAGGAPVIWKTQCSKMLQCWHLNASWTNKAWGRLGPALSSGPFRHVLQDLQNLFLARSSENGRKSIQQSVKEQSKAMQHINQKPIKADSKVAFRSSFQDHPKNA